MELEISNCSNETIDSLEEFFSLNNIFYLKTEDIISYISEYLNKIIEKNKNKKLDKQTRKNDVFYSKKIPNLTIKEYIIRIRKYSDIEDNIWYMYDNIYNEKDKTYEYQKITDKEEINKILSLYIEKYLDLSNQEEWFNNIKLLCDELGYASNMKDYKNNPDNYKGNVADISTVLRVSLTSKSMTPDLYEIMKLLGKDRIISRYKNI